MAKDFFVNEKNKTDQIKTKYSKDYQLFVITSVMGIR